MGGQPFPQPHYPREFIGCVCFIFNVKLLVTPVLISTKGGHLVRGRRKWRIYIFFFCCWNVF